MKKNLLLFILCCATFISSPASAEGSNIDPEKIFSQAYTLAELWETLASDCKIALEVSFTHTPYTLGITEEKCMRLAKFMKGKGKVLNEITKNEDFHRYIVEEARKTDPYRVSDYMANLRNAIDYTNFINEYFDSY